MATALAIGAVTFAVRYHPPAAVAPVASVPVPLADTPAAVADSPAEAVSVPAPVVAAPAPIAPMAAAPAAITPKADAPAAVAHRTSAVSKTKDIATPVASEPKAVSNPRPAVTHHNAYSYSSSVTSAAPAIVASGTLEARANDAVSVNSANEPATSVASAMPAMPVDATATNATPANAPAAVPGQVVTLNAEAPTSDSSITNQVKTQIAADNVGKDSEVGVTTTLGVVMLSGTLATQEAIDHVKGIAGKVKDVKSVDASGLKVATT